MLPVSFLPSLPAVTFTELESMFIALKGTAREFQVDIVDGCFVPHTSWPFTEANPLSALERLLPWSTVFSLEIDCMVCDPYQYLDTLVAIGAKSIIIHMGSTNEYDAIIAHAERNRYRLGFAVTADVPIEDLAPYISQLDFVQLMGIAKVGQQGQPFDERILARARELRLRFPELEIAVDGSVNATTIPKLFAAGVNRFAPGSAIAKAADPCLSYLELIQLVRSR